MPDNEAERDGKTERERTTVAVEMDLIHARHVGELDRMEAVDAPHADHDSEARRR